MSNLSLSKRLTVVGFFIAVFIVGLDSFIISSLLPTIATAFSTKVANVGFGVTVYAIFYAVGAPIIAPFSERLPRKMMIVTGLLLFTIATFLCGTATNLTSFYIFRALAGLGAAMFTPNVYAYIGNNFAKEDIGKIMGIVMSALSLSIAVGVPAGSFIANLWNWNWTFFGSSIFAAISWILIILFVEKDVKNQNTIISNPLSHYINVIKNPRASLGLLTMLFWMYGFYAIYTYLGTYIGQSFHLSVGAIGLVFMVYGLSNFVSSFSGGWIGSSFGMKKVILFSGIISCAAYLILGVKGINLVLFIIILAILAFAQGVGAPQLTTFNATILPESRATMTSLNSSFLYLGLTLGSALGGVLLENLSFTAIGISAVVSTVIAILISQNIIKEGV